MWTGRPMVSVNGFRFQWVSVIISEYRIVHPKIGSNQVVEEIWRAGRPRRAREKLMLAVW